MSYKIVMDSCGDLPEEWKNHSKIQLIPLTLQIGEEAIVDDETFDQLSFLKKVAAYPECPKSACPSPQSYMESYGGEEEHVYVITLSSHLSGSYNSAVVGKDMYLEQYGEKKIHVIDSESASTGETQIALKAIELEESGKYSFEEIVEKLEKFRSEIATFFVLDSLEALRKNGRLSAVKALVANTLNIKPVMEGRQGVIFQAGQGIGIKKALNKMADALVEKMVKSEKRVLMISHCNNRQRAEYMKELVLKRADFAKVYIVETRGVSSLYASDGGIIVTA